MHRTVSLFLPLLRLLLPAAGRHRTPCVPPATPHHDEPQPPTAPLRPLARPPVLLRGEDVPPVRPYVLTETERQQWRLRHGRPRALWLAAHGVDIRPRRLHGTEAAA
ncbi:hypothetical protein [Streptomyces sp. NPDC057579]|uniref:hypothetical protein n=1 Tax=Streptomyces sp. NPDC057579 TaxID=3346172 RepID=UPI003695F2F0